MRPWAFATLVLACDLRLLDNPAEAEIYFDSLEDRTAFLQSCAKQLSDLFGKALEHPLQQVSDEYVVSINRFQALAGILRGSKQGFNHTHWSIILSSLEIVKPYLPRIL